MATNPNPETLNYGLNQDLLYGLDNPDFSWRNAMQDYGYNPYAPNPFTKRMAGLGSNLANSYVTRQATNPYATGSSVAQHGIHNFADYLWTNLNQAGNPGKNVGDFNTGPGTAYIRNPFAELGNAAANVPQTIQAVRDYRTGLNNGTVNAGNLNPFMAKLSDQLGANGGLGTADWLASIYTPFMSSNVASSYRNALQASGESAIRRAGQQPITSPQDIWSYMLGI